MGKYGYSVFVGNLSRRVRSDDLKDAFRDMGRINDVDIKTGYAFIEFDDKRDAEDACKELNGIKLEGERISVEMSKGCRDKYRDFARTGRVRYRSFSKEISPSRKRYRSRSRGGRSRSRDRRSRSRGRGGGGNERPYRTRHSLTVENLSSRCSWSDLKDTFRKCGKVTYTDAHQRIGSGRGEVCFDNERDLKQALKEMNGVELNGRKIEVFKTHGDGSRSRSRSRSGRRSRSRSRSGKRRSASRSRSRSGRRSRSRSNKKSRSRSRSNKRRSESPKKSRSRSRSEKRRSRSRS